MHPVSVSAMFLQKLAAPPPVISFSVLWLDVRTYCSAHAFSIRGTILVFFIQNEFQYFGTSQMKNKSPDSFFAVIKKSF